MHPLDYGLLSSGQFAIRYVLLAMSQLSDQEAQVLLERLLKAATKNPADREVVSSA